MRIWTMRAVGWAGLLIAALVATAVGCSNGVGVFLQTADAVTDKPAATPSVLGRLGEDDAVTGPTDWTQRRAPLLRELFVEHVYGPMPAAIAYEAPEAERIVVNEQAYGGRARLEVWTVRPREDQAGKAFTFAIALPNEHEGPWPVIVTQQFCGVRPALGIESDGMPADYGNGGCDPKGFVGFVMTTIFGKYVASLPWDWVLDHGYAAVVMDPGEVVIDNSAGAPAMLAELPVEGEAAPEGAIAAWAWAFSRIVDVLDADERFDSQATVLWGHSRFGKAALVAAAYDDRPDVVIAHQSGTGGATLSRNPDGESVALITEGYPHWFASRFADYADNEDALPIDQHQLLALIAPRPVLLGNARRDVWSGPEGAFRAAQGADAAYELLGVSGLDQARLDDLNLDAELGFYLRPGRHGVTSRDWTVFLDWLDAQLGRNAEP